MSKLTNREKAISMVVKAIVRGDQIMWVRNVSHNEKFATYYLKVNGEKGSR